jgi:hypothetical protein
MIVRFVVGLFDILDLSLNYFWTGEIMKISERIEGIRTEIWILGIHNKGQERLKQGAHEIRI